MFVSPIMLTAKIISIILIASVPQTQHCSHIVLGFPEISVCGHLQLQALRVRPQPNVSHRPCYFLLCDFAEDNVLFSAVEYFISVWLAYCLCNVSCFFFFFNQDSTMYLEHSHTWDCCRLGFITKAWPPRSFKYTGATLFRAHLSCVSLSAPQSKRCMNYITRLYSGAKTKKSAQHWKLGGKHSRVPESIV